jgi:hypothetical protein
MRYVLREDYSLARAWREYLGLTQDDRCRQNGHYTIRFSANRKLRKPRKATRQKLSRGIRY